MSTASMRYGFAWVALAALIGAFTGGLTVPEVWKIVSRGAAIEGVVIDVPRNAHNTVRYKYVVDGRTYNGQTQSRPPNKPTEQLAPGETVMDYYDSEQPDRSILGSPRRILYNEVISALIAAIFIPSLILIAWRFIIWPGYRRLLSRIGVS
jgi:hypothetical protein